MISKFYDVDPDKTNYTNKEALLKPINLVKNLWTTEGKYKASHSELIRFEADSFFCDPLEVFILQSTGAKIFLKENQDYFLSEEEDLELGSPFKTSLGIRLLDTANVRLAYKGQLFLKAWVARQTLKAEHLNEILSMLNSLISKK